MYFNSYHEDIIILSTLKIYLHFNIFYIPIRDSLSAQSRVREVMNPSCHMNPPLFYTLFLVHCPPVWEGTFPIFLTFHMYIINMKNTDEVAAYIGVSACLKPARHKVGHLG